MVGPLPASATRVGRFADDGVDWLERPLTLQRGHCADEPNPHVADEAVVTLACLLVREQAKEQEKITYPVAVAGQMRLRRALLAQDAFAAEKLWVMMAIVLTGQSALGRLMYDFTQANSPVGRRGVFRCGDGQ